MMAAMNVDQDPSDFRGHVRDIVVEKPLRDGVSSRETFRFNRMGKLIQRAFWASDGIHWQTNYTHDEQGLLVEPGVDREVTRHSDGSRTVIEKRTERGAPRWLQSLRKRALFELRGPPVVETTYDSRGFPSRTVSYDDRGEVLGRREFLTDERGNVIEEKRYGGSLPSVPLTRFQRWLLRASDRQRYASFLKPGLLQSRIISRYDHANRLVERKTYLAGEIQKERVLFTYNERGDLFKAVHEFGSGRVVEYEHQYEYDAHGNWTRQTARHPGGSEDIRRTITYYDNQLICA
jgi:YD repeat-containing protein